ncbi:hypothetical protein KIPB_014222 [Kipferlia bialata]|uniref:Uncharacterized protein n=1 Tax=Kipferlia bialata TaxID=797122 RepID=A0A9K3DBG1_9EUKA|nr:hypothetical protein KIPB_014222 [Kipferlia bialata]|eukprot:g14222.t1
MTSRDCYPGGGGYGGRWALLSPYPVTKYPEPITPAELDKMSDREADRYIAGISSLTLDPETKLKAPKGLYNKYQALIDHFFTPERMAKINAEIDKLFPDTLFRPM